MWAKGMWADKETQGSARPILAITDPAGPFPQGRDFLDQVEAVAKAQPRALILRAKDRSEEAYGDLARAVIARGIAQETTLILHGSWRVAQALAWPALHLPLPVLRTLPEGARASFQLLGASVHSPEEAQEAEALGASYLLAGHVFETSCKPGRPPRGLAFLAAVLQATSLPVYALGGITPQLAPEVWALAPAGLAVRSALMMAPDPKTVLAALVGEAIS